MKRILVMLIVTVGLVAGINWWKAWLVLPGPSWPPCTQATTPGAEG